MRLIRAASWGVALAAAGSAVLLASLPVGADPITGQDHPANVTVLENQYLPDPVRIKQGESFKFGNYDPRAGLTAHSLVELIPGCTAPPFTGNNPGGPGCPAPRFDSGLVDFSHVRQVAGTEKLPPGTYEFICQVHGHQMKGILIVEP